MTTRLRSRWETQWRIGPPINWPSQHEWESGFNLTETDDLYNDHNPYDDVRYRGRSYRMLRSLNAFSSAFEGRIN
jgi:hypothetical protein